MNKRLFPSTVFGFHPGTLLIVAALLLIFAAALGLDLKSQGRVYNYLWSVTGETEPAKQLLGFGQYLMSSTRRQPDTQPYARIQNNHVNPFGVNTFLEQEVEPDKRERQVQMIRGAGFHWIRQQFPWEDIEIDGKGDFIDRRHDRDGDGVNDEISAWDKYDNIVELADTYDLQIIARLSAPPAWSQPPGTTNHFTPPADFQDFVDYAVAVASRYRGRIHHYQVWNEPNLYPEWGDQTVNAEAYTDLLCRTYRALKAVDPDIRVITGAIGPTIDLSGRNAYDVLYLQRMYQAGAGDCFDILSVQGYGLWSGPTDHRLRQVTINYQRHLWIRDLMVANGDAEKPIWISEAAWNPVPNDPTIADLDRYGRVTMEEAAEWAPLAYERAIKEWPWIGVINYWYFKPADDHEKGQSPYYFRLVEPDFTPTPIYESLKAYATSDDPRLFGPGRHSVERGMVSFSDITSIWYRFRMQGTNLYACYDQPPLWISYSIDRSTHQRIETLPPACVPLGNTLDGGEHTVEILLPGSSDRL